MPASYEQIRDTALSELKNLMDSMQNDQSGSDKGKKLAYWLNDYVRFLKNERTFNPKKMIRYKRGSIVKVHLGYNIGSEEGGLHYAIVMDNASNISDTTLTVIPLTSAKPGVDLSRLHFSKISLGDEVYRSLNTNLLNEVKSARARLNELSRRYEELKVSQQPDSAEEAAIREETSALYKTLSYCQKMRNEVDKMKTGSIALVGQITTISKIRIYDPRYHNDALAKVRVSNTTLDVLDRKIAELYMNKNKITASE